MGFLHTNSGNNVIYLKERMWRVLYGCIGGTRLNGSRGFGSGWAVRAIDTVIYLKERMWRVVYECTIVACLNVLRASEVDPVFLLDRGIEGLVCFDLLDYRSPTYHHSGNEISTSSIST